MSSFKKFFQKGLTHDFCHKFEIFSFFVFRQYKPRESDNWCARSIDAIFGIFVKGLA